jgi:nitric oxide reductase subunit B
MSVSLLSTKLYTPPVRANAIEWARLPGDIIFAAIGVVPLVIAAGLTYLNMKKPKGDQK